ncbi:uncharacterized protein F5147DRAFT_714541 [Suillus discolor]|uniref:Uncharacterized protein n=1 Tax=Suillus discolor TaxID=1912936 RepID=A0A9P7EZM9_9AGAM|nr:uncharacterized protein F5147DRAFT_714541 [Suillus discolor]KAG2097965.1 hypothetical protein F5147DRAFT_714541 [Suillus discolor]
MDSRNACIHLKNTQQADDRQKHKHKADARTSLRTLIVHGDSYFFGLPDEESLIWDDDFRWRRSDGLLPSCEDFDWLVDYLVEEANTTADNETVGDALLALSAMPNLRSSTKRHSYITALIRCMDPARPPRVRHAALRAIDDAREELSSMTNESIPQGVDAALLDKLSCAILTAVRPNHSQDQTVQASGPDTSFHEGRDACYSRLIFALLQNDEWRKRLTRDGHFEHCVFLAKDVFKRYARLAGRYFAGIFAYINPSDKVLPLGPAQKRWQAFIRVRWDDARYGVYTNVDRSHEKLTGLTRGVYRALESMQRRKDSLVLYGVSLDQVLFDAALSSVQGLYDDLRRMIEDPNALQTDNASLES